mgnify:CR=1 FL=1
MKNVLLIVLVSLIYSETDAQNVLYLDQNPPSDKAILFAPGIISNEMQNRDITFSSDGTEIYFRVVEGHDKPAFIAFTKFSNGAWSKPERASFCKESIYNYLEPVFFPDGQRLYFVSDMPDCEGDTLRDDNIWYVSRRGNEWSAPVNIGFPVNTDGGEYFPSFTVEGDIYFTRNKKDEKISYIYKSEYRNGVYMEPVLLPDQINCGVDRFNAYVSPDDSFVVIPAVGVEEGKRGAFYYIVFRDSDGEWSYPVNMGDEFNTPVGRGWSFSLSPDLKYAFFMATSPGSNNSDIFWISTDVIKALAGRHGKVVLN